MKKLITISLTILFLGTLSFAESSAKQKIAEELNAALTEQKAVSEEKAQKEQMEKGEQLFLEKYPTFSNIPENVRNYMVGELGKNRYWKIEDIKYKGYPYPKEELTIFSSSGEMPFYNYNDKKWEVSLKKLEPLGQQIISIKEPELYSVVRAWNWHKENNPEKYFTESVTLNARPSYKQAVANYLYEICKGKACILDSKVEIGEILDNCCNLNITSGPIKKLNHGETYTFVGSLGTKHKVVPGDILVFMGCDGYDVTDLYNMTLTGNIQYMEMGDIDEKGHGIVKANAHTPSPAVNLIKKGRNLIDSNQKKSKTFVMNSFINSYYKKEHGREPFVNVNCVSRPWDIYDRKAILECRKDRKNGSPTKSHKERKVIGGGGCKSIYADVDVFDPVSVLYK